MKPRAKTCGPLPSCPPPRPPPEQRATERRQRGAQPREALRRKRRPRSDGATGRGVLVVTHGKAPDISPSERHLVGMRSRCNLPWRLLKGNDFAFLGACPIYQYTLPICPMCKLAAPSLRLCAKIEGPQKWRSSTGFPLSQ